MLRCEMVMRSRSILRLGSRLAAAFLAVVAVGCLLEGSTGVGGLPAALTRVGDSAVAGAVSQPLERPLVVKVTNARGDSVAGVAVTWTVTAGGGSVSPVTSTTDTSGHAR